MIALLDLLSLKMYKWLLQHLLKTVLLRPPFHWGCNPHFTGVFTPVNPQIWLKLYLIFFIRAVNLYEYSYETNKENYRYVFSYMLLSIFHFIFESLLTKSFEILGVFTEYFCRRCENWICITVLPFFKYEWFKCRNLLNDFQIL